MSARYRRAHAPAVAPPRVGPPRSCWTAASIVVPLRTTGHGSPSGREPDPHTCARSAGQRKRASQRRREMPCISRRSDSTPCSHLLPRIGSGRQEPSSPIPLAPMNREHAVTPPPNTRAVAPHPGTRRRQRLGLRARPRRVVPPARGRLPRRPLGAVARRAARAHRRHRRRADPLRRPRLLRGRRGEARAAGVFARGRLRRRGDRRRAVRLRRGHHGLGGRAPRARPREPRRSRPTRPVRRRHAARPGVAHRRAADRARRHQGRAQHLSRRADRVHRGRVPARRPLRRRRGPRPRQRPGPGQRSSSRRRPTR